MLFIDQPVGTGYSYVDNNEAFTTDVDEIATDLITMLTAFMETNPEFEVCARYRLKLDLLFLLLID